MGTSTRGRMRAAVAAFATLAATVGTLAVTQEAASAAPLTNGSFETPVVSPPNSFDLIPAGQSIGAWSVTQDAVHLGNGFWQQIDGQQTVDLSGAVGDHGKICQSFDTTAGQQYYLGFWLSRNDFNGGAGGGDASANVTIDGVSTIYTHNTPGWSTADMKWQHKVQGFIANGASTQLCFADVEGNGFGAVIDAVTVDPAPAFDCRTSTIFVAQSVGLATGGIGTQLSKLEAGSGSSSFVPIGDPSVPTYNSIAYDPATNLIIGDDTQGNLIAVDANGDPHVLAQIPISNNGAISGGTYYFNAGNEGVIRTVNLSTLATGSFAISQPTGGADFTFIDGLLWGNVAGSQQLFRVDPATGQVTVFPAPFLAPNTGAGAAWTYPNGNLGLSNNGDGKIYQIAITGGSTATPTFTLIATSSGPSSNGNDGTSCDGLPADLHMTKTSNGPVQPGATITWTITVTNEGPGASSGYVVTDTLPLGVTNVASSTPGCTVAGNKVTCVGGVLPAGESDVITITGNAPNASGTVANTATVTGNEPDRDPSDNSASSETTVQVVITGLCRGTAVQLLGLHLGEANGPESPCVTQTNNLVLVNQTIGTAFPWPLSALTSSLKASAAGSNTLSNPRLAAAESHVAAAVLNLPLIGLNLAVTGVQSTATAVIPGAQGTGCAAPQLAGTSIIASVVLNGGVLVVGSNPVSIPLPGLGGIYLNQRVVQGNTIIQRAVFVDLPGTALDVTIAESKAAISCT